MTYLFPNDYVRIVNGKNEVKFEGYYCSVKSNKESLLVFQCANSAQQKRITISSNDRVLKVDVSILGKVGGEVRCSEPFPSIGEKESR